MPLDNSRVLLSFAAEEVCVVHCKPTPLKLLEGLVAACYFYKLPQRLQLTIWRRLGRGGYPALETAANISQLG